MPPCELQQDFALSACKEGVGGIRRALIGNRYLVDYTTLVFDVTGGQVDALEVITPPALTTYRFYEYAMVKQTSNYTSNVTASVENGTVYYEQLLTLILNTMDLNKRNELELLAKANTVILFEDNAGLYWMMGLYRGADVNGGTTNTGTAFGDRNGYEITFQGMESVPVYKTTEAVWNALYTGKTTP